MNPQPLKIGPVLVNPPVLQAPMAGYTNYAFREMVRRLGGVGLPATEMISARGFIEMDARRGELPDRLWGVRDEPRPLAVQIWDNDPVKLAAVGRRLAKEFDVSVVDINFGCPVRDVAEKARSGSYLLRYPDAVAEIVSQVVAACDPIPVTAKIRLGTHPDAINAPEVAEAIEMAGAAALTVHGRTAKDMFRGRADWDRIAQIKPHLKRIPLIGNGDLTTPQEVVKAFRQYDVDGVMIGRAAMRRPWLFRQCEAALAGQPVPEDPTLTQRRQLLVDHYRLVLERFGPHKATVLMRRYACHWVQGQAGAREFRRLVSRVRTAEEFLSVVEQHFPAEGT